MMMRETVTRAFMDMERGEVSVVSVDTQALTLKIDDQPAQAFKTPHQLKKAYLAHLKTLMEYDTLWDEHEQPCSMCDPFEPEQLLLHELPALSIRARECDEGDIPLGASKRGGWPDLPAELEIPAGTMFAMQLNLAELERACAQHGLPQLLPPEGMLYLFVSETIEENVILWSAQSHTLARCEYEAPSWARYYARELALAQCSFTAMSSGGEDGSQLYGEAENLQGSGSPFNAMTRKKRRDGFPEFGGPYQPIIQLPIADGFATVAMPAMDMPAGRFDRAICLYVGT